MPPDEGYAFAHRNELTIHIAGPGVDPKRLGRGSIYMQVDDADALAEEWRGADIDFVEPRDFEYGKREGSQKIPTGTSFASDHRFGVRAVWLLDVVAVPRVESRLETKAFVD
jgi:hypothetical protein